jgi:hypothetical protein
MSRYHFLWIEKQFGFAIIDYKPFYSGKSKRCIEADETVY